MYVLMYFVNLPKTELPREKVFSFLLKSENTSSLTLEETLRSLVYFMKKKHGKIKLNLNFYLLSDPIKLSLEHKFVPVILCLSRMTLRECNSSRDKKKTSLRQPSRSDTQLKVHQIHTSIETQSSNLCHIWYWNILPCV